MTHIAAFLKSKRTCLAWLVLNTVAIASHAQTTPVFDDIPTNKYHSASGKWLKASNTNCLMWDSFARESESVTWSGDVVDGKAFGKGVVQWFTNGVPTTSYEGEMREGLADGHGIARGYGTTVEGEFKEGTPVSRITIHYPTGGWYKGESKDGFKEGQGEEVMIAGGASTRYMGQFKRDRFDGPGVMIWPNGGKVSGDWKDFKLVGSGTYTWTNGDTFKVKMTAKGIERE